MTLENEFITKNDFKQIKIKKYMVYIEKCLIFRQADLQKYGNDCLFFRQVKRLKSKILSDF